MIYRLTEIGVGRFGPVFQTPMEAGAWLFSKTFKAGFGGSALVECFAYDGEEKKERQFAVTID